MKVNGYTDIIVNEVIGHKNNGGVLSTVFKARIQVNGAEKQLFIKTMPGPDQSQRVFIDDYALELGNMSSLLKYSDAQSTEYRFVIKSLNVFWLDLGSLATKKGPILKINFSKI